MVKPKVLPAHVHNPYIYSFGVFLLMVCDIRKDLDYGYSEEKRYHHHGQL